MSTDERPEYGIDVEIRTQQVATVVAAASLFSATVRAYSMAVHDDPGAVAELHEERQSATVRRKPY